MKVVVEGDLCPFFCSQLFFAKLVFTRRQYLEGSYFIKMCVFYFELADLSIQPFLDLPFVLKFLGT